MVITAGLKRIVWYTLRKCAKKLDPDNTFINSICFVSMYLVSIRFVSICFVEYTFYEYTNCEFTFCKCYGIRQHRIEYLF
jgi:hypothetical protein